MCKLQDSYLTNHHFHYYYENHTTLYKLFTITTFAAYQSKFCLSAVNCLLAFFKPSHQSLTKSVINNLLIFGWCNSPVKFFIFTCVIRRAVLIHNV